MSYENNPLAQQPSDFDSVPFSPATGSCLGDSILRDAPRTSGTEGWTSDELNLMSILPASGLPLKGDIDILELMKLY